MSILIDPFNKDKNKKEGVSMRMKSIAIVIVAFIVVLGLSFFWQNSDSNKRDRTRLNDLKEVREALFFYYNENGYYPSSISDWNTDRLDYGADPRTGSSDYDNLASLISHRISKLPKDPLNKANSPTVNKKYLYRYVSSPDGQNFAIIYETEEPNDESPMIMEGW